MGEKGSRAGMREIRRLCTRVDERTCQEQGETGRASSQQGMTEVMGTGMTNMRRVGR